MTMTAKLTAVFAIALLSACSNREIVVLLPEADGTVGNLSVGGLNSADEVVLAEAYQAARTGGALGAPLRDSSLSAQEVEERFGNVTGILPEQPDIFVLYFPTGKSVITAESASQLEDIRNAIDQRPAPEVEIVGHTDTVGDAERNDELSIDRANAARLALLTELGISGSAITTSGRGERDLAVATADNVAEARNRRVELRIR